MGEVTKSENMRQQQYVPYPRWTWYIRPFKTVLIVTGAAAGILWLIGGLIDGIFPAEVTVAAAVSCVSLFMVYFVMATYSTHRQENFAAKYMKIRKEKIAEFEAMGFVASRKFIGSSRIFAVDETMGKYYLIDYFNKPEAATLHDISRIRSISKAINREYVPRDNVILLSTGHRLNRQDNDSYFSKTGVLLALNEEDETLFINCFKTENDADLIIQYLSSLLEKDLN